MYLRIRIATWFMFLTYLGGGSYFLCLKDVNTAPNQEAGLTQPADPCLNGD